MKRFLFENVSNMRDLGGCSTKNGKITKYNSFIRSSLPNNMLDSEINLLLENNIKTIIDLRNSDEVNRKKNCLNKDGFNYYNISLRGDKCPDVEDDISTGYIEILKDKETIEKVFSIILNSNTGILFNCSAGKDRTGVIAMLLLLLAGVSDDDIIADYSISYIFIRNQIKQMHIDNPDLPAFLGGSKYEYMEEALNIFYKEFGDIEEYLKWVGFNSSDIDMIKNKIV